ncbi:MAG: hypothetical protein WD628_02035, partial [Thermomicrobiales bacterium]
FQSVSLYDRFEWTETGRPFEYVGPPGVEREDDLVWRALASAPDLPGWTGRLRIVKRIPIAAGLGGGSADAALALRLAFPDAGDAELSQRGAQIGADVPFFVLGGTALATETGAELTPIETPRLWFVLVTPDIHIPEKTRALYSGLEPGDFSDGANVRDITTALTSAKALPGAIPNAFTRQLLGYPVIRYAYDRLGQAGATRVSVSGAGPTLYALTTSHQEAARIAARLDEAAPRAGTVNVVRAVGRRGVYPAINAIATALRGR